MDNSEIIATEEPAVENGRRQNTSNPTSMRSFILGPLLAMYVFACTNSGLVLEQFVYYYMQKTRFPNTTFKKGEQTLCIVHSNTTNITLQNRKEQEVIQEVTANFMLYTVLAFQIPSIFSNIFIGYFSDRFGRKRMLVVPLIATFIKDVLCIFGLHFEINVNALLLFYSIEGCGGGWIAALAVGFAFVADVTRKGKSRSFAIVLVEICLGFGAILGGVVSGYSIKGLGFTYSMAIGTSAVFISIILVFCLPETVTENAPAKQKLSFFQAYKDLVCSHNRDIFNKRWKYIICFLIFLFTGFSDLGKARIDVLYLLNFPFCWSSVKIGWYVNIGAAGPRFLSMLLVKPLQFCFNEATIGLLGSVSSTAGKIFEGFATTDTAMYLVPVFSSLYPLTVPMIRAIISQMTPPDLQGAAFSCLAVIETISSFIGSLVSTSVYSATVSLYKGITFCVYAANSLLAAILLSAMIMREKSRQSVQYKQEINITV